MPITLGKNLLSLQASRQLSSTSDKLGKIFEKLSSGQRINRASDDAAGLSVASGLNADTRVYTQAVRNFNDGISALSIADQTVGILSDITIRQRELAEQAANGSYSSTQRTSLNSEAQSLAAEYSRLLQGTKFNNQALLDGSQSSIVLQGGYGSTGTINAQYLNSTLNSVSTSSVTDAGTNGNQHIAWSGPAGETGGVGGVLVGDLNGDGYKDIAVLSVGDTGSAASFVVQVYTGSASGTYTASASSSVSLDIGELTFGDALGGVPIFSAALVDRNSDGKLDIAFDLKAQGDLGHSARTTGYFANTTVGTSFNMSGSVTAGAAPTNAMLRNNTFTNTADLNNDGFLDNITVGDFAGVDVGIRNTNTTTTTTTTGGIQSLAQSAIDLTTQTSAKAALDSLTSLLSTLSQARGKIGSALSRIQVGTNVLRTTADATAAAEAGIVSADTAQESASLAKLSILQNVDSSLLAQANQQPKIALQLLEDVHNL